MATALTSDGMEAAITYSRRRILECEIRCFGVPYIVVDDLMPEDLLDRVNTLWPEHGEFGPEIPGNFVQHVSRAAVNRLPKDMRTFWSEFRDRYWMAVMAACAERLSPLINPAVQGLLDEKFSLEVPLALMEADERFAGHQPHTHFYHNPNWVFTALFYADPDDTVSQGTTLHYWPLGSTEEKSNYIPPEVSRRSAVAMDTLEWRDESFESREIAYKANRLLIFLDGPMAFHSVRYTALNHQPDPRRAADPHHARRRILRAHAKVDLSSVLNAFTPSQFAPVEIDRYKRLMQKNPELSLRDKVYRQVVVGGFYRRFLASCSQAHKNSDGVSVPYERLLEQLQSEHY